MLKLKQFVNIYEETVLSELVGILRTITLNTGEPCDAISAGVLCHFDAPTSTTRFTFTSRFRQFKSQNEAVMCF